MQPVDKPSHQGKPTPKVTSKKEQATREGATGEGKIRAYPRCKFGRDEVLLWSAWLYLQLASPHN